MKLMIESYLKSNKDEIIKNVVNFVKIPSVLSKDGSGYPYGLKSAEALDFCIDLCRSKGFYTHNYEYYCAEAKISKDRKRNKIIFVSHVDVVPPDDNCIYGAFSGTIVDNYIIGRGVVDNKAPSIATIYALNFFKENNIPLINDFILLFGANEEMGMDDIDYYLSKNPQPDLAIAVDDDFPVVNGEKGQICFSVTGKKSKDILEISHGRKLQQPIPYQCTAQVNNDILPSLSTCKIENNNPINDLINKLSQHHLKIFESQNQTDTILKTIFDIYGSKIGIDYEDKHSGKLVIKPTSIYTSDYNNLTLEFDIRYPVSDYDVRIINILTDLFTSVDFNFKVTKINPGYYLPKNDPIVTLLTDIYNKNSNSHDFPYVMNGCTYARKFQYACGFGAGNPKEVKPFEKGHGSSHGPDEAHNIDVLLHAIKIYILGIKALDDFYSGKSINTCLSTS